MGQFEAALEDLLSIVESQDPDVIRELAEVYYEYGLKFFKAGNFKKAIELFDMSLRYRETIEIHLQRGSKFVNYGYFRS